MKLRDFNTDMSRHRKKFSKTSIMKNLSKGPYIKHVGSPQGVQGRVKKRAEIAHICYAKTADMKREGSEWEKMLMSFMYGP